RNCTCNPGFHVVLPDLLAFFNQLGESLTHCRGLIQTAVCRIASPGIPAKADPRAAASRGAKAPEVCKNLPPMEGAARPSREGAGNAGYPMYPQPVCKKVHTVVTT